MEEGNIEYNNKILDCIIDICESHPPKYNNLGIEGKSFINDDFFTNNLKKYFSTEEIMGYEGKEELIHDYNQFINNNLFYNSLLDDFKLYMCNILLRKKKIVLLYPDNYNEYNELLFDNNISFIYFYNFILFMKSISNKFPQIINESIYKIDLILIISIFSPDYHITFENGVIDKYGINYESYSILMIELIDFIKAKKYEGYNDIIEIEKYEFKYPKSWQFFINKIESEILDLFFFKNYINRTKIDDFILNKFFINEENDSNKYFSQIKNIYMKFKENKNLDIDKINENLNTILHNISKINSFENKKLFINEIISNININNDYKLLNENNILNNLVLLYEFYSFDINEINLQLIYSFDFIDNLEKSKYKLKFEPITFLNFIKNRKKIIQELKKSNNYTKEFKNILEGKDFRNKIKTILNSSVVKNYYENPKYYFDKKTKIIESIGDKKFSEIYEYFLKNYIENDEIYDKIIIKRMPYGLKGTVTKYLCFIIDPFGVDMNNNLENKNYYLETYLIILFLRETNVFSKRSFYMNRPLSICKTPNNCEGGDSIIRNLFGEAKISIINIKLCDEVNNLDSWRAKTPEEIKKFKKTLKNIIESLDLNDVNEEKLIEIKNTQNCLISFSNYKKPNISQSKKSYSGSNNGFFRF